MAADARSLRGVAEPWLQRRLLLRRQSIQQPVDYPDWCKVVRKPESCRVAIVMKANRRVPCTNNIAPERLAMRGREGWN
ncbi:hypothetical protein NDU88_000408 [Pleurodeles waltl]|uniref:Uncharacterized protein n=1 Tax=Pleurodeles waltl TaxID=8319 RepID=A0AAV7KVJ4_PLEWA|nr:hypothetical protein NDU88_000408 [Pleurodeles waltl]